MLETVLDLKKVLLVDDDDASIQAARQAFPQELVVARTADELAQALGAGDLDAVVCEVSLLPQRASIPIVAVSARPPAEAALQALRAGAVDCLQKPLDWAQVKSVLRERVKAHRHQASAQALHGAMREVSRFLHHFETVSTPLGHGGVLRQLLTVAVMAAEADGGWLFLAEKGEFTPVEAVGYPLPARDDVGEGLFRDAFKSRREQCVALAGDEDPAGLAVFERDKASLLAVPLTHGNRVLGIVELARNQGHKPFRPEHISMLSQLARLGAVVVHAQRQEEQGSRLLARTLQRILTAHEEKSGHSTAEVSAAVEAATHAALGAEAHDDRELLAALREIRELGGGHLEFWKDTLVRYVAAHRS